MPNWCMNKLTVTGTPEEVKRFVFAAQGLPANYPLQDWEKELFSDYKVPDKPYFCFNALVPTPDSVIQMGFDGHDKLPKDALLFSLAGKPFEPIDGYHWNIQNWGTKWDVYSDHITPEDMGWNEECNEISFSFDTAWSPPTQWFSRAAEQFPALRFVLHYAEPGCYFAGDLIGENGKVTDIPYTDKQCAEEFADLDEDDCLTDENGGSEHGNQ